MASVGRPDDGSLREVNNGAGCRAGVCRVCAVVKGMTLTELTAIAGLVFGVVGSVLGVMSFMRDRTSLKVALHWDWKTVGPDGLSDYLIGVVSVQNVGRRPVYVNHVDLVTGGRVRLMLTDSMAGIKLAEGDAPLVVQVRQEGLEEYALNWWLVRAEVKDALGRVWRSPMNLDKKPSWAIARE